MKIVYPSAGLEGVILIQRCLHEVVQAWRQPFETSIHSLADTFLDLVNEDN